MKLLVLLSAHANMKDFRPSNKLNLHQKIILTRVNFIECKVAGLHQVRSIVQLTIK